MESLQLEEFSVPRNSLEAFKINSKHLWALESSGRSCKKFGLSMRYCNLQVSKHIHTHKHTHIHTYTHFSAHENVHHITHTNTIHMYIYKLCTSCTIPTTVVRKVFLMQCATIDYYRYVVRMRESMQTI